MWCKDAFLFQIAHYTYVWYHAGLTEAIPEKRAFYKSTILYKILFTTLFKVLFTHTLAWLVTTEWAKIPIKPVIIPAGTLEWLNIDVIYFLML